MTDYDGCINAGVDLQTGRICITFMSLRIEIGDWYGERTKARKEVIACKCVVTCAWMYYWLGAFVMPGNTFLGKAGPLGTAIAMGIAALIMIIIAFNYNFMINKFPVAGGEFTYTQQAFGERHALH